MLGSSFFLYRLGFSPLHHLRSRRGFGSFPSKLFSFAVVSSSRHRLGACRMSYTGSEKSTETEAPVASPPMFKSKIRYCQVCGNPTKHAIPDGEEKIRAICTSCGRIHYENPKMVVGCLVEHDNKILLCRRKIEPSYGLWTLPAGYLEIGESAVEGATRETIEEACARVEILSPFVHLDIPLIGQVLGDEILKLQRAYLVPGLKSPDFSPGPESLECALFSLEDIPFDSLAFSSIIVTLKMYTEDVKSGKLKFHYCTIKKRPGASPSDLKGFDLDSHLQL